jgi:hypothetical protein
VFVSVYFVSESQITHPQTVTVDQVVTERNAFFLFSGGHCDAVLLVEGKEGLGNFDQVCFCRQPLQEPFPLDHSTAN